MKAPSRVAFFGWTAALGKILTHDNLRKRNIVVVEWCYMCKKSEDSIDHLLLHCEVACRFGIHVYIVWIEWVMLR